MSVKIECGNQSCFVRNGTVNNHAIHDPKNNTYITAEGYENGGFVTVANSPTNKRKGFSVIGFFVENGEKITGKSINREDSPLKIKALRV